MELLIRAEFQASKINYPSLEMGVPLGPTRTLSESSEQEYFYSRITKQTKGFYDPAANSVLVLKV